jgi:ElaB/YqjD/DUF883 family membrane-anchored ribosome-binding protein
MGQSSDELRQEIDQRRHDAEQKINDLQGQIQGTTDGLRTQAQETAAELKSTAQETVTELRDQVQGTVDDTIQTVKENINFEQFVQERPLVSLGAALIGGFVLGGLLNDSGGGGSSRSHDSGSSGSYSGSSSSGLGHSLRSALKSSGLEDTVNSAAAAMMGSMTEQLKQTMDRNMPGFADRMSTAQQTEGSVSDKSRQVL